MPIASSPRRAARPSASCKRRKAIATRSSPRPRVEADRFIKVYEQYKKAPDVTRQRIFIETMEKVLGDTDKVIIDDKAGPGVVPYLPLSEFTARTLRRLAEGQP